PPLPHMGGEQGAIRHPRRWLQRRRRRVPGLRELGDGDAPGSWVAPVASNEAGSLFVEPPLRRCSRGSVVGVLAPFSISISGLPPSRPELGDVCHVLPPLPLTGSALVGRAQ